MRKILTGLILLFATTSFAQNKTYKIGVLFDKYNNKSFNYVYQTLYYIVKKQHFTK